MNTTTDTTTDTPDPIARAYRQGENAGDANARVTMLDALDRARGDLSRIIARHTDLSPSERYALAKALIDCLKTRTLRSK